MIAKTGPDCGQGGLIGGGVADKIQGGEGGVERDRRRMDDRGQREGNQQSERRMEFSGEREGQEWRAWTREKRHQIPKQHMEGCAGRENSERENLTCRRWPRCLSEVGNKDGPVLRNGMAVACPLQVISRGDGGSGGSGSSSRQLLIIVA